jgi:hypothetical protein
MEKIRNLRIRYVNVELPSLLFQYTVVIYPLCHRSLPCRTEICTPRSALMKYLQIRTEIGFILLILII